RRQRCADYPRIGYVGHADLKTTSVYAHARPGESSGRYLKRTSAVAACEPGCVLVTRAEVWATWLREPGVAPHLPARHPKGKRQTSLSLFAATTHAKNCRQAHQGLDSPEQMTLCISQPTG